MINLLRKAENILELKLKGKSRHFYKQKKRDGKNKKNTTLST